MSDQEFYRNRQEHLSRLSELSEQVGGTIEDDRTRLMFMGRMPDQIEGFSGQKANWQAFKHWLFTAMYWLVRETDQDQ